MKNQNLFRRITALALVIVMLAALWGCIFELEEKKKEFYEDEQFYYEELINEGWDPKAAEREAAIRTYMAQGMTRKGAEAWVDEADETDETYTAEEPTFASYLADESELAGLPREKICGAYQISGTDIWEDYVDPNESSETAVGPMPLTVGAAAEDMITVKFGDAKYAGSNGSAVYDPMSGTAQYYNVVGALMTLAFREENGSIVLDLTMDGEDPDSGRGQCIYNGTKE